MTTVLEWAVAAVTAVGAVASVRGPRPWLVLAAAVGALLVPLVGQVRWQLVPGALAIALLAGVTLLQLGWPEAPTTLPRLTALVVLLGIGLSATLVWALPVPRIALEDGSGPIGTVAFDLVDPTRSSPSARTGPDEPRRTTVQAWYPATAADGERLRITDEPRAFADAVSQFLGLPAFALTHLGATTSSAHVGAPVDAPDERLPVVLSLHGWGGFRFAQTPLLEQLAADGHLVLAIDHTHGSLAAQPVDGEVVPIDPRLLPNDVPPQVYDAAAALLEQTFAADAAGLLTALRTGDAQVPEAVVAAADLDRLVVLGHSTGGGAAALLCATEPRCDGLVGYDPWVEPVPAEVRAAGFAPPTLVILSEEWDDNDNAAVLRPMVAASDDARLVTIEGTKHRDVTVEGLLSPLAARLGIAGSLGAERTHELALELTRAALAGMLGTGPGDPATLVELPFDEVR